MNSVEEQDWIIGLTSDNDARAVMRALLAEHSNRECYEPPFDGEEPQEGSTGLDLAGVAVLLVAVCCGVALAFGWLA